MKKALVTGGATGIGKSIALLLKKSGYDVFVTYNKTPVQYEGVTPIKCDLKKYDDIEKLFNEFSDLDVLVNNAGVSLIKLINDTTEEEYDNLMAVNAKSYYFCSKMAVQLMIKNHNGKIVNIASMWGEVGASCEVAYSMSKSAVIGLTKALAKEVAPSGITVNCVSPGIIDTRMNNMFSSEELAEEVPLGRLGKSDEIATAVLSLINNDYITGQVLSVNGGII